MPFKHQTESYRTRDGIRYVNEGDILDERAGDLRVQAKAKAAELRAAGRPAFIERQDGDWYRVFAKAEA